MATMRCCGAAVALLISACACATTQDPGREAAILEAEARAASLKALGQWVEVPSGRLNQRRFVAVMNEPDNDRPTLVHVRTDQLPTGPQNTATRIRTLDLDCAKGQERLLMTREFDANGTEQVKAPNPNPGFLPIERVFTSAARYVCTGEYLFGLIPDGHARVQKLLQARMADVSAAVPSRQVPVPDR
jgi:hypothetical protein